MHLNVNIRVIAMTSKSGEQGKSLPRDVIVEEGTPYRGLLWCLFGEVHRFQTYVEFLQRGHKKRRVCL